MIKIIIVIAFMVLAIGGIFLANQPQDSSEEKKFQGPVPEGYDEQYFRETGETKLLEGLDGRS